MTWDWTQVSRTIGEHSAHLANEPVYYFTQNYGGKGVHTFPEGRVTEIKTHNECTLTTTPR